MTRGVPVDDRHPRPRSIGSGGPDDTDVGGRSSTVLAAWLAVVCFAYYYKPLVFGVGSRGLGFDVLTDTWIHRISLNHWIETVLYPPLVWIGLYVVSREVFGDEEAAATGVPSRRRDLFLADFALALMLFGFGIHVANVIEIYSRGRVGVADGPVYELTYFLDEDLSHYVIHVGMFFALGWFVLHDPPRRTHLASVALALGLSFGVERAVALTESGKWFLAFPVVAWLLGATGVRVARHHAWAEASHDFFVRFALGFCVMVAVTLIWYRAEFGSFRQPSSLPEDRHATLMLGMLALTAGGLVAAAVAHRPRRSRAAGPESPIDPAEPDLPSTRSPTTPATMATIRVPDPSGTATR